MSVGSVLSEALDLYKRHFTRFFLTAAAVFVLVDLLGAIATDASSDGGVGLFFWRLVYLVIAFVGSFWVQGALVAAVADVRDGKVDSTVGDLYDRVRPHLAALISSGVLAAIGIGLGILALVIPGLILITRWILIVPVIVLENRSAGESFGRSRELVRGNGRSVFLVIIVTLLIAVLANGLAIAVFAFLPDFLQSWIGGTIASSLTAPFVALAWTVMYFRLSGVREPAEQPTPTPV